MLAADKSLRPTDRDTNQIVAGGPSHWGEACGQRSACIGSTRSNPKRSAFRSLPSLVIAGLIAGLAVGAAIRPLSANSGIRATVDFFDVIGTMWVAAIRMTVIPLIVPLLIVSIANARSTRAAGRLGVVTIIGLVVLIAVVAAFTSVIAPLLFGGIHIDPAATASLRASAAATSLPTGDASLSNWFKTLIPANPIKAAADGTMLSIIVFALAFGFATLAAPEDTRDRVVRFSQTLSTIMFVMVQAVLSLAPIGVFALTLVVGARVGVAAFGAMGYFVGGQLVTTMALIVVMFALTVMRNRLSVSKVLAGAGPAMLVAASTSSSLSALPAMIESARDEWNLPEETYGFVLPLAVSTFKPTSASSWVLDAYFVAILYGIPFGPAQLALAAGYSVLFNATVPGIPGGGVIVMSPLFLALGLPLEGLAILLAINPIVDRILTVGNVVADMAITALLARPASRT